MKMATDAGYNLHCVGADSIGISLDETSTAADVAALLKLFGKHVDDRQFRQIAPRPLESVNAELHPGHQ